LGFRPGCERANLILSTLARLRTAWGERLSRVEIAAALSPAADIDRRSPSSSGVHGGAGAVISSPSALAWHEEIIDNREDEQCQQKPAEYRFLFALEKLVCVHFPFAFTFLERIRRNSSAFVLTDPT
jgi:hypothetical protein